jgi:O-antigen chain-terminating methyltransferase
MTALPELKTLVAELREVYQPIYGHAEFAAQASRACEDRLYHILAVYDALTQQLQRPLRVLDLGCAQGWFSFKLAEKGAQVLGVDYLGANINVCNILVLENRNLQARFKIAEVETIPELLETTSFDLVLGLSVFHHLALHNGKEATRHIIQRICEKIPHCFFEFALKEESDDWAMDLPDHPNYFIDHIPFSIELGTNATHLSAVGRPLYFCSQSYWYLNRDMHLFTSWQNNGHGRRYYFGEALLAKVYKTSGENGDINRHALMQAANFLKSPPSNYPWAPRLLAHGETRDDLWLVQEKIQGQSLLDLINSKKSYNEREILLGVLKQLVALETNRLFHADVRVWNIIVDNKGFPALIDYNEISPLKRDCAWPENPFLAFFIFVNEVVTHNEYRTDLSRAPFISPYGLPQPYRQWGVQIWNRPANEWSFALFLEALERLDVSAVTIPDADNDAHVLWMKSMEENIHTIHQTMQSLAHLVRQFHAVVLSNHQTLQKLTQDPAFKAPDRMAQS